MGYFTTRDNTNQKDFKKQGNSHFANEGKKISFDHDTDKHKVLKIVKKEGAEIGFLPSEKDDWLKISKFYFMIMREAADCSPVGYTVIKDISFNSIYIKKEKKTRLVASGFEEQNSEVLKDSPSYTKNSTPLVLSIIFTKGCDCNSTDIKSVFLQSKEIGRNVYLIPPTEAESENVVWGLNSCIHDLVDVSRNLYLPVKDELTKIRVKTSKYDPAAFYYYVQN